VNRAVRLIVAVFLATACSGTLDGRPSATNAPGGARTDAHPSRTSDSTVEPISADLPLWQTAEMRDVRTGETFSVSELSGRVVVVEPMAIWCASCRAQQDAARDALSALDSEQLVYLSLDIDPNETEPDLASYAEERGYEWRFVLASVDVARSLAESFGDQVLSPPSTPKILVAPDGQASVSFGFKPAAELHAELAAMLP